MFLYLPMLLSIPLLLIVGIFLVLVPGGFIVILIGAYTFGSVIELLATAAHRGRITARGNCARSTSRPIAAPRAPRTSVRPRQAWDRRELPRAA
jgi:hypothetical protein